MTRSVQRGWRLRRLLGLALAFGVSAPAHAHTRSQSFSSWYVQDDVARMTFSVEAREVTRLSLIEGALPDLNQLLAAHLRSTISMTADGAPCPPLGEPRPLQARDGYVRVEWTFHCPPNAALAIINNAFFDVAASHVHYARLKQGDVPPVEYLFSDARRKLTVIEQQAGEHRGAGSGFLAYVRLGVEHILAGVDHIAFLLTLLLLCRRPREVFFMVTGFTLGHSATLGLAVLGVVEPNVPVIEALIGYTIALVAVENLAVEADVPHVLGWVGGSLLVGAGLLARVVDMGLPPWTWMGLGAFTWCYLALSTTREQATRLRPMLTVLFGLIHGFAFGSVLMDIGLPKGRLLQGLFGFNVGVELGQLGIVLALWSGALLGTRWVPHRRRRAVLDLASAGLCAVGVFWLVQRALLCP